MHDVAPLATWSASRIEIADCCGVAAVLGMHDCRESRQHAPWLLSLSDRQQRSEGGGVGRGMDQVEFRSAEIAGSELHAKSEPTLRH